MSVSTAFLTDIAQPWGSDFVLTENDDLALVSDTLSSPAATRQRLFRLVLTNPRIIDPASGVAIARGDDLFNQDWGAGLPGSVGEPITSALILEITARVQNELSHDPAIATSPAPVVTVTQDAANPNFLVVFIQCDTVVGATVEIPSISSLQSSIVGG